MIGRAHYVRCPYCAARFELFAARWCRHGSPQPSKICPECQRCLCDDPAYRQPHFWAQSPPAFERQGFRRLFLYYL